MTARKRAARDNAPTPAPTCGPGEVFTARSLIASGAHARATGFDPRVTWVALSPTCAAVKVPTSDPAVRVAQLEMFAEIAATFTPRRKAARAKVGAPLASVEARGAEALAQDDCAAPSGRAVMLRIPYLSMDGRVLACDVLCTPGEARREIAAAGIGGRDRFYPVGLPHVVTMDQSVAARRAGSVVALPSQLAVRSVSVSEDATSAAA